MARAVGAGLQAAPWAPDAGEQAHLRRATGFYLWTQTESGHLCPISMTYSAIPALRHNPELARQYEPGLRSRSYDFGLRPPPTKAGLLAGMSMTEKQGGSDLRAGTTRAVPDSRRRRSVPVDRPQMVHLGPDERRLPHPRPGARRADLLPAAPGAAGRHPQRDRPATAEGQARQPVERLGRDRVRQRHRLADRRRGTRRANHSRDGDDDAAGLRARLGRSDAGRAVAGGLLRVPAQLRSAGRWSNSRR